MPLYELYRLAKGKLDSNEMNNTCGTDQSSIPENDLVELVWENGQISMRGQSSRARKSPTCGSLPSYGLPSHSPKSRDKGVGYGANTRMGKFGDLDSGLNDIPMPVSSGEVDLIQDEEMISWLDCTTDDTLPREYSSDFLLELPGVTVNELPASNNCALMDRRSNYNQVFKDSHKNSVRDVSSSEHGNVNKGSSVGETETTRPEASTSQLYPPSSQQCRTSFASFRSQVSDITENKTSNLPRNAPCAEISDVQSGLKILKQDPRVPSNSSTILNFSQFVRPSAIMRANLQSMANKNKDGAATSSNPPESRSGECLKESTMHCQQVVEPSKADLKPVESKTLVQNAGASERSDPVRKEGAMKDNQTSNQVLGESVTKGQTAGEKSLEPAVASSSVCSGNGVGRSSDDPNQNLKRKSRDTEDSEWHSEDVEEESVSIKKAAHTRGVTGSKRSRAAEVHNLSERRRRDRINEKMRALQELIPNCNKVDKASMLDEAIEYLKTLQLQVQIMSMGAGLYMPPMMLPPGMQHFRSPHIASFSPMGIGMQMGLGMAYGMGMPEMNGGSSRFPMIQVAQMQGTHFPFSPMPGHNALHGMARPNPVFGLPGQGHPIPMPRAPILPSSGEPITNSSALGSNASGAVGLMQTVYSASSSGLQDRMPNVNSQVMQSTACSNSTSQMSTQCEAKDVGLEQSALVLNSGHAPEVNGTAAVNPDKEDNLVTGGKSSEQVSKTHIN